jgi:hypothetical protein
MFTSRQDNISIKLVCYGTFRDNPRHWERAPPDKTHELLISGSKVRVLVRPPIFPGSLIPVASCSFCTTNREPSPKHGPRLRWRGAFGRQDKAAPARPPPTIVAVRIAKVVAHTSRRNRWPSERCYLVVVGAGPPTTTFSFRTKESRGCWPSGHHDEVAMARVNLKAGGYKP